jgi:hypothetical protein
MELSPDIFACFVAFTLVVYLYLRQSKSKFSELPLPPGPPQLPVIGNLFDVPRSFEWRKYQEWGKEYGEPCGSLDRSKAHTTARF